ncbi:MAG: N-acetyl-alpha-D-glucosaminyl L-malate synthase BshA [Calditrichaeota bacterium]|nr:N-acetyl-alpha-D-glucosaminyl L-malate synthase BshA [Calditrichota bacterium]
MKIGITCYPTYGGSGVIATELGKKLAEMGHEVHFISYALPYRLNRFQKNLYFHEVEVLHYPLFAYPPYSLALTSKIVEVAEFAKLDILHAHYAIPHATSACLARDILGNSKLKIVTTLHGTDITLVGKHPSFKRTVQYSINKSDGVTAVSNYLAKETCAIFNINQEIRVIYNFLHGDLENQSVQSRKFKDRKESDPFILCHISNFRSLKRVRDLIPIVERLKDKFPVKMYMVGDGPERSVVEHLCHERKLCDHFVFLGKQDSVVDILNQSDLFILPSEHESFGLSALEAMACGVPCVTSDAGGLTEVNIHGKTGLIASIGNIDQFVEHISTLLSDPQLRQKFSENARKSALKNFSSKKIVPQYVSFYEEVIGK